MKLSSLKQWNDRLNKKGIARLMPRNKKGNMPDLLYLPAIIFATGVVLFLIYYIWVNIQPSLSTGFGSQWSGADAFYSQVKDSLRLFDTLYPLYLVGSIIFILISAYYIKSYPIFFFISTFILIIAILLGSIFANVHRDMIRDNAAFAPTAAEWEITNWIINRLPMIILVVGVITMILLYSKVSFEGVGGMTAGV